MIHTVKNPFFCRTDQFKRSGLPGRVLVIGIDLNALSTSKVYRFRIGKSSRVYYGDSAGAKAIAQMWVNRKGKTVAIVPVGFFKVEEVAEPKDLAWEAAVRESNLRKETEINTKEVQQEMFR